MLSSSDSFLSYSLKTNITELTGATQQEDPCAAYQRCAILGAKLGIPPHALAGRLHLQAQHRSGLAARRAERAAASYRPHLRAAATARAVLAAAAAAEFQVLVPPPEHAVPSNDHSSSTLVAEEQAWTDLVLAAAAYWGKHAAYQRAKRDSPDEQAFMKELPALHREVAVAAGRLDVRSVAARLAEARPTSAAEADERQRRTLFGRLVVGAAIVDDGGGGGGGGGGGRAQTAGQPLQQRSREVLASRAVLLLTVHISMSLRPRDGVRTEVGPAEAARQLALAAVLGDALLTHFGLPAMLANELQVLGWVVAGMQAAVLEDTANLLLHGLSGPLAALTSPDCIHRVARCLAQRVVAVTHSFGPGMLAALIRDIAWNHRWALQGAVAYGAAGGADATAADPWARGRRRYAAELDRWLGRCKGDYAKLFPADFFSELQQDLCTAVFPPPAGGDGAAGGGGGGAVCVRMEGRQQQGVCSGLLGTIRRQHAVEYAQERVAVVRALLAAVAAEEAGSVLAAAAVHRQSSLVAIDTTASCFALVRAAALSSLREWVADQARPAQARTAGTAAGGSGDSGGCPRPGGGPVLVSLTKTTQLTATHQSSLQQKQPKPAAEKTFTRWDDIDSDSDSDEEEEEEEEEQGARVVKMTFSTGGVELGRAVKLRMKRAPVQRVYGRTAGVMSDCRARMEAHLRDAAAHAVMLYCGDDDTLGAVVALLGEMSVDFFRSGRGLVVAPVLEASECDPHDYDVLARACNCVLREVTCNIRGSGGGGGDGGGDGGGAAADRGGAGREKQAAADLTQGRQLRPDWQARQRLGVNRAMFNLAGLPSNVFIGWKLGDEEEPRGSSSSAQPGVSAEVREERRMCAAMGFMAGAPSPVAHALRLLVMQCAPGQPTALLPVSREQLEAD